MRSDSPFAAVTAEKPPPLPAPKSTAAAAGDHETLEEVIRAYAAYEDDGNCGLMDKESVYHSTDDAESTNMEA